MTIGPSHDMLQRRLDELVEEADGGYARLRRGVAASHALPAGLPAAAAVMAIYVLAQLLARLGEWTALRQPWWAWLLIALATWAGISFRGFSRLRQGDGLGRRRALAKWDKQLHLADRLGAADEFLHEDAPTPFMEAAIDDAQAAVPRTKQEGLAWAAVADGRDPRWNSLLPLAMCLVVGLVLGRWEPAPTEMPAGTEAALPTPPADSGPDQAVDESGAPTVIAPQAPKPPKEGRGSQLEADVETHAADQAEGLEEKKSRGEIGTGRSSEAESSTGAGNAQGTPSKQGQISKPGERKESKAKEKKPQPPKEQDGAPPKRSDEQESGSTAGRGSSRGSNRNPAASAWSSKDHVNTPDDQDLDEEDDVDDEEEEQESRGGMQPTMRDRKPPVSRDLTIGFGNQPSDDAKGRGGPSAQKKSRGTASLVLGVPIPDRVKGQPNPGKTKITQERVQPQAEPAEALEAEARLARAAPASALRRESLAPWMDRVVRDYFLKLRQDLR